MDPPLMVLPTLAIYQVRSLHFGGQLLLCLSAPVTHLLQPDQQLDKQTTGYIYLHPFKRDPYSHCVGAQWDAEDAEVTQKRFTAMWGCCSPVAERILG